jgi:hypothetical protein
VWEPDGRLLTVVDDGREAIVRCSTGGQCELATGIRDPKQRKAPMYLLPGPAH